MKESPSLVFSRPQVNGKFFDAGNKRFYIKGVTYGTFMPDEQGYQFPPGETVEKDFKLMSESGINLVRTYTVPSLSLLDMALKYGLRIMVGLPWMQHLTFLDSMKDGRMIIETIRNMVISVNSHPAIMCFAIGNEIPANIVRWYGEKKIEKFLEKIFLAVKKVDPDILVTYVNYPTTEYLNLPFLDFFCFNVYLETREKLSAYLARLHNLVGEKPLVMAEIGLDSFRNGEEYQSTVLDWQIRTIFEKGCAGACVFSWTDDWWRGGMPIDDWNFGIVDRERNPKPAYHTLRKIYEAVPLYPDKPPRISVVICTYNGSATIRDSIQGCLSLDYPDYELIVVNDGSTDQTWQILDEYHEIKVITTENRGLSSARNTGMEAASGEIVAYLDDDAWPDTHWLKYLATAYRNSTHAGIGGPNIAPDGDGELAKSIAYSPGRPVHVLTTDEIAEHIPGCNMSFKRKVLLEAGGFDPVFRSAGDDVDICWRIQELGYTLGFHPSAFVWHHCRNSFRMYWKQQQGYGKAEALLERKWPERYNRLGHLSWTGSIYGNGLTKPLHRNGRKIYYGSQGTALFQSVYQPSAGFYRSLPLMPEWYLVTLFLGLVSLLGIEWKPLLWTIPLFANSVFLVIFQAGLSAKEVLNNGHHGTFMKRLKFWGLTTLMHLVQPYARLKGRINNGLTLWKDRLDYLIHFYFIFSAPKVLRHWSEEWKSPETWLEIIYKDLISKNNKVKKGGEFDRWDFQNMVGLFGSVRTLLTIEEHGMGKQMLKLKKRIIIPRSGIIILMVVALLAVFSFTAHAYVSFAVFCFLTVLTFMKIISDTTGTVVSISEVFQHLPGGINNKPWEEQTVSLKGKGKRIPDTKSVKSGIKRNKETPVFSPGNVYYRNLLL